MELLRRPSGFLPLAMSAVVLGVMAIFGPREVHLADEGVAAHVFQALVVLQVPVVAFFALTWLPRRRTGALGVLALQCGAALVPIVLVAWLRL